MKPVLGPLKACFDQLDQKVLKTDPICQIHVFLSQGNRCFMPGQLPTKKSIYKYIYKYTYKYIDEYIYRYIYKHIHKSSYNYI